MAYDDGGRRNLYLISFNGVTVPDGFSANGTYDIYADHRPTDLVLYPLPQPTDENANGRGIGMRGYYRAQLVWDFISDATFQWWAEKVSEAEADAVVTGITLRTPYRRPGADGPDYHRIWMNGLLTRIVAPEGTRPVIMDDGNHWLEGPVEVWFNRLGGVVGDVPTL